jgi:hypothetical protein
MKISQLLKDLQAIEKQFGDLDINIMIVDTDSVILEEFQITELGVEKDPGVLHLTGVYEDTDDPPAGIAGYMGDYGGISHGPFDL